MSKIGEVMINEKTRVSISLATLITLFGAVFYLASFKAGIETRLDLLEEHDAAKAAEILCIEEEQDAARARDMVTQTDLAEIKTDLKWIRATLSED